MSKAPGSAPTPKSTSAPAATVLTSAQTTQLIQRLRTSQGLMGGAGGSATPTTIKIQTVQNPSSGVRQIIAIPIQAAPGGGVGVAGGNKLTISPMKVKSSMSGGVGVGTAGVKVVKLASASSSQASTSTSASTSMAPQQLNGKMMTVSGVGVGIGHGHVSVGQHHAQVVTPLKNPPVSFAQVSAPATTVASVSAQGGNNQHFYSAPGLGPGPGLGLGGDLDALQLNGRKRSDIDFDAFSDAKRRKTEKGGKGLRHFSMKVCEKVQAKGSTSYNEVADELVAELTDPRCTSPTDQQYDQKNIRRRVYDALNVLMAMNIISKEKKEIRWLGLPTNSVQEANNLEADKASRMDRIRAKTQQLQDLILQQIAFKNLVERNKEREKGDGPPAPNSAIQLPFIIVNTSKKTIIDCSISNDKMEYLFNFDDTFEIHDDMEVLKRMGLGFGLERGQVGPEDLAKARQMVPRALEQYVVQMAENGPGSVSGMPEVTQPLAKQHQQSSSSSVAAGSSGVGVVSASNLTQMRGLVGGGVHRRASDVETDSDVDIN